ncbi:MAG: hypothetical protein KDG52_03125 [Rhodocyclaceae bacterium]|nr:hypothetical protein [Rhodocyclaceae bacterium]
MKRLAIPPAAIAERKNLLLASWKACRGKRRRPAVAHFLADLDRNIDHLADAIRRGSAPQGVSSRFVIHDPKRRVIHAACLADRILHHAILNLAEPRFEAMLVDSCYACRPGKGVHAAVAAVQRGLRRWPWFVQVDVDAYFPSIRHELLLDLLARRFKGADFLALLARILRVGATAGPGRGLPIGALTSQHFANAFLDSADRLVLARAGCGGHVRYMDDLFWGCASRAAAEDSLAALDAHLREAKGLALKARPRIARSREGARFCGFRVRQGVILPGARKMARFRAAMMRIDALHRAGLVDEADCQRAWAVHRSALHGAASQGLRRRLLATLGYDGEPGGLSA